MFGLLEQLLAHRWNDLPVAIQSVYVALQDATARVTIDVLDILQFGAVDVAREVEVEVGYSGRPS